MQSLSRDKPNNKKPNTNHFPPFSTHMIRPVSGMLGSELLPLAIVHPMFKSKLLIFLAALIHSNRHVFDFAF
jgi:hypothetical protein